MELDLHTKMFYLVLLLFILNGIAIRADLVDRTTRLKNALSLLEVVKGLLQSKNLMIPIKNAHELRHRAQQAFFKAISMRYVHLTDRS